MLADALGLMVTYSDVVAHLLEASVEASLGEILTFAGVTAAVHEDGELILVGGRSVDRAALDAHLRAWWRDRFRRTGE